MTLGMVDSVNTAMVKALLSVTTAMGRVRLKNLIMKMITNDVRGGGQNEY